MFRVVQNSTLLFYGPSLNSEKKKKKKEEEIGGAGEWGGGREEVKRLILHIQRPVYHESYITAKHKSSSYKSTSASAFATRHPVSGGDWGNKLKRTEPGRKKIRRLPGCVRSTQSYIF